MTPAEEKYLAFKKEADLHFGGLQSDITDYIDELKSKTEWISTKDRLPEDGQIVAFIIDESVDYYGGSKCAGRFRYFNYGDRKEPEFGTWGLGGLTASHWMPLPEIAK